MYRDLSYRSHGSILNDHRSFGGPVSQNTNNIHDSNNANTHGILEYLRVAQLINTNTPMQNNTQLHTNRLFVLKSLFYLHLFLLVVIVSLTFWAIFHYNVRFYKIQTRPSEAMIVLWLLRAIWHIVNSTWALKYHAVNSNDYRTLRMSHSLYNIFTVFWIGLTIYYLGINPHEDLESSSSRICYFLLCLTIASYIVPMITYAFICLLLYFALFLIIYFRHGTLPTASCGIPKNIISKLKTVKYKDVLVAIKSGSKSDFYYPITHKDKSDGILIINSHHYSPDVVITVSEHTDDVVTSKSLMDACDNDAMLSERLCAICILDMNDDDKVLVLPCDIRHVFHKDCLLKWFKKSKYCPICRSNICDVFNAAK